MLKECKSWFVSRRLIWELKCSLLLSSLASSHNGVLLLISPQHLNDLDHGLTRSSQIHRFHWQNYNSEAQKYLRPLSWVLGDRIHTGKLNSWRGTWKIRSQYQLPQLEQAPTNPTINYISLLIVLENLASVSVMALESGDSCSNISDSRLFSVSQRVEGHTLTMVMDVCINLCCRIKHKDYDCRI